MSNPANLVAGLLDELESAERTGDDELVAQIDEQIDAQREALEGFEPSGVDEEAQRKHVSAVKRRLAAADRGERLNEATGGEPRVHNHANYLTGLLDEREGAMRAGRPTDDIDAEIQAVRPHFDAFQPADDEAGDAKKHYAAAKRRLADLGKPRTGTEPADQVVDQGDGAQEKSGKGRTTKAAAAPRTATPPPAQ
jgi:hypothetical protein